MARRPRGESIRASAAGVNVSVGVVGKTLVQARLAGTADRLLPA